MNFNLYLIPPVISLIVGLGLAILFLVKGKFKKDNVLFALICIWWSLLSPIFISHHIFRGNIELILKIERSVHFFYVFIPVINLLHFYNYYGLKRRYIIWICLVLSSIFAVTTQTQYYISGLYTYSWGYMAKGGIAFQLFGLYGTIVVIYFIVLFFRMLKTEKNKIRRMRLKYIIASFNTVGVLTMMNLPALNGIDIYPLGNFMFIPLLFLAYSIFRYRFMDIETILSTTLVWAVISSLILVPNIVIFLVLWPYIVPEPRFEQFPVLIIWFLANYFYMRYVQPKIDQLFNRRKYNLRSAAAGFIENISLLHTLDALINEFIELVKKNLSFKWADIYIKDKESGDFINREGYRIKYNSNLEDWFMGATHLTEKSMVETDPYYSIIKDVLIKLFEDLECSYSMPLVHNNQLLALLVMPEKYNLKPLTSTELKFMNNIISTMSISLANSLIYQELSDMKDNLESLVKNRTIELHAAMEELESINETLTRTNRELEVAQMTARKDMEMAKNVQASILQLKPPITSEFDIAVSFKPMAGVSGDLYDFYERDGKLLGIAIFDVSGHGIASGLITMIVRSIFRRHFFEMEDRKLNAIVETANIDLIKETEHGDQYLSGIFLRFNDHQVEYVNAGHPDIYYKNAIMRRIYKVNKKTHDFKGLFLGSKVLAKSYEVIKFQFGSEDALLLYTDCLIEGKNKNNIEYSETRLKETFIRAPDGTAREILDFMLKDFNGFIGDKKLNDDLTVIIVKRKKI